MMTVKMRIKEFSVLTGVSVRTLHYYDKIGLLKPAFVDRQNGYRFYDEASLARMQEILFYRELDFPLDSIRTILSAPYYDKKQALAAQKKLLILKKERLERLIAAIDSAGKGESIMTAFDNRAFEDARSRYQAEAREKWGHTSAYAEHKQKTKSYTKDRWDGLNIEMMQIFKAFAACMQSGDAPDSARPQALVQQLQAFITENYYTCTPQILENLGEMYTGDGRFRETIDQCAIGTAEYVSKAIAAYCG